MQMRTCASAGVTAEADRLASLDNLVFFNEPVTHVAVYCFQTVGVTKHYVFAISGCFIFYHTYFSRERCTYCVANIHLNVEAFVGSSPSCSKITCHHTAVCRHTEMSQVYAERIRQFRSTVCVCIVPIFIKCIGCKACFLIIHCRPKCQCINHPHVPVNRCLLCQ